MDLLNRRKPIMLMLIQTMARNLIQRFTTSVLLVLAVFGSLSLAPRARRHEAA